MKPNIRLSIVIPVFKPDFLREALDSLIVQTCKDFNLYIGNDDGPEIIDEILSEYVDKLKFTYKRFERNLGSKNLVKQWERCIALTKEEEYIWLFPDDDLMPEDAVERFYNILDSKPGFSVYRFGIELINNHGHIIRIAEIQPKIENVADYLWKRLNFMTLSSVAEYIFSKTAFLKNNGFVDFPLAWCSDDATWIALGREKGICYIDGKPVSVRLAAGINITSSNQFNNEKFESVIRFVIWVRNVNLIENFKNEAAKYLISQVNYLRIDFWHRLFKVKQITKLIGLKKTMLLMVNKGKLYKRFGFGS